MNNKQTSHPPSLRIFFTTEMWERYGFYVVQTLLALFLSQHCKWDDKEVYVLVGSFTAITYASPVVGGWIADYLIGQKRAILSGAVILLLCYLALACVAFEGGAAAAAVGVTSTLGLTAALAGIAVGTGLLKPNISSLLGNEYPDGSPQREHGFTIFYMGITSGIILGSTLPAVLNYHFGWSTSFISAAIGMLIAIAVFAFGIYRYHIADYQPYQHQLKNTVLAGFIMFFLWLASFYILHYPALANSVFIMLGFLSLSYFFYAAKKESSPVKARKIWVISLLCLISVMFWALYFQMFLSLTLFISRIVEPTLWGIQFPPPYYVCIQSMGAILFGFFLVRRKNRPSLFQLGVQSGNKFVLAMLFMTIGYIIISSACHFTSGEQLISPYLIMPAYLMISLAELFLYPVGLSAVTVLASSNNVSTMMGIFFVSLGMGGFLSGKLAYLTAVPVGEVSVAILKAHYAVSFNRLLYILIACALIAILLNRVIRYLLITSSDGQVQEC